MHETAPVGDAKRDLFGHPRGLYILFLLELWERFSFYGMRALLIFFLTQHFLLSDDTALHLYGSFFAITYGLPVIGGLFADRLIGARKAVLWGGILLAIGQAVLAISASGPKATTPLASGDMYLTLTFLGLSLIAIGVGFLKPNSTTMVGMLYGAHDHRRDSGFTIFYVGINVGAAIAAITCGYVGQVYGWSYGFGMATLGMLIGLITYTKGYPYLMHVGNPPSDSQHTGGSKLKAPVYMCALLGVVFLLTHKNQYVGHILVLSGVLILAFVAYYCTKIERIERHRLGAMFILIFFLIVFFSVLEQMGGSLNLFTERYVDREVGGFHLAASQFLALNPIFILTLGPVLGWVWARLAARRLEPSTPMKFVMALVLAGLGFLLLSSGGSLANGALVAPLWIVGTYFLLASGELFIAPIALSMVTKLSPISICGLMMGNMFLSTAGAGFIAAQMARLFTAPLASAPTEAPPIESYVAFFNDLGVTAIVLAGFLLLLTPFIKRLMHGVK